MKRLNWMSMSLAVICLVALLIACGSDEDSSTDGDTVVDGDSDVVADGDDAADGDATDPGLTWIAIPGGTFQMGCVPIDNECSTDEMPRHEVTVDGFSMSVYEVTQAQYEAVMGTNPSTFGDCDDCPVEKLSWLKAKEFCEAFGARLPTEAEWEYAARGGVETIYTCGDDPACLDAEAWSGASGIDAPKPVGSKDANAFGLFDIQGNVNEWVEDCYLGDFSNAPTDGSATVDDTCEQRIFRSGDFNDGPAFLRLSRRPYAPQTSFGGIDFFQGVRCAKD